MEITNEITKKIIYRIIFQAILDKEYGNYLLSRDASDWLEGAGAVMADTFDILIPPLDVQSLKKIKRYMNR